MQIKADVFQHVAIYQYVEHYFYDFLFTFFFIINSVSTTNSKWTGLFYQSGVYQTYKQQMNFEQEIG